MFPPKPCDQTVTVPLNVAGTAILYAAPSDVVPVQVCTGVFPVTGQNMPLLAMGGSALIMTCVGLGVVQSFAYRQEKAANDKKSEEIA